MLCRLRLVLVVGAAYLLAGAATAEVVRFDAVLEAKSQELIAGELVSFDEAFEEFEVTSDVLPLQVASKLDLSGGIDTLVGTGRGFADFFEPVIAAGENPAEFGLEADCFSLDNVVAYRVSSSVVETRTIVFSRSELDLTEADERDVESSVFLSGAMFVWSMFPGQNLDGLSGRLTLTIEQVLASEESDAQRETVFSASVEVGGDSGGTVEASAEEGVEVVFGGAELLTTGAADEALLDEYLGTMGDVWVLLIPDQELVYTYPATAGEEFQLEATVVLEVVNVPGVSGIATVFGRDFDDLDQLIDEAFLGAVSGKTVQTAVNRARTQVQAEQSAGLTAPAQQSARACGAIGPAMLSMLAILGLGVGPLRRGR